MLLFHSLIKKISRHMQNRYLFRIQAWPLCVKEMVESGLGNLNRVAGEKLLHIRTSKMPLGTCFSGRCSSFSAFLYNRAKFSLV